LGADRTADLLQQFTDFYQDTRAKLQVEQVWVEDDAENPSTIYKKQHLMSQLREEKALVPHINNEIAKLPDKVQKPTAYLFTARHAAPLDTTSWIQNFGDRFFLPDYRYNYNYDVLDGFALCIQSISSFRLVHLTCNVLSSPRTSVWRLDLATRTLVRPGNTSFQLLMVVTYTVAQRPKCSALTLSWYKPA
jgi:hypothetical protein